MGELKRKINVSQSVLSQYLAVLRTEGLVNIRREAQSVFYLLADSKTRELPALRHELYCRPSGQRR